MLKTGPRDQRDFAVSDAIKPKLQHRNLWTPSQQGSSDGYGQAVGLAVAPNLAMVSWPVDDEANHRLVGTRPETGATLDRIDRGVAPRQETASWGGIRSRRLALYTYTWYRRRTADATRVARVEKRLSMHCCTAISADRGVTGGLTSRFQWTRSVPDWPVSAATPERTVSLIRQRGSADGSPIARRSSDVGGGDVR